MACAPARAALSLALLVVAGAAEKGADCASAFQQCGGPHFDGPTCCEKGCRCSDRDGGGVYSQCVPPVGEFLCRGSGPAPTPEAPAPTPEAPALALEAPAPTPEEEEPIVLTTFDCDADDESERSTWSAEQKDWCCTHEKKGCAHEKKAKASSSSSPEKKSAADVDGDDDASEGFCCVAGTDSCGRCPKESRISSEAFCGSSRESCESCTKGARWCADSSSEIDIVRKFSLRDASGSGDARWPAFGSGSHALSLCMVLVLAVSGLAAAVYRSQVRPYRRV